MLKTLFETSQIKLTKEYAIYYKTWLASFCVIIISNILVHNLIIDRIYNLDLEKLLRPESDSSMPAMEINLISYAIVIAVMVFFISRSLTKKNTVPVGALYGILFGAGIYIPHTLTNLVMIKYWTNAIVIMEICWGILQGVIVGLITAYMYKRNELPYSRK